jgi:hypothetical protein
MTPQEIAASRQGAYLARVPRAFIAPPASLLSGPCTSPLRGHSATRCEAAAPAWLR